MAFTLRSRYSGVCSIKSPIVHGSERYPETACTIFPKYTACSSRIYNPEESLGANISIAGRCWIGTPVLLRGTVQTSHELPFCISTYTVHSIALALISQGWVRNSCRAFLRPFCRILVRKRPTFRQTFTLHTCTGGMVDAVRVILPRLGLS